METTFVDAIFDALGIPEDRRRIGDIKVDLERNLLSFELFTPQGPYPITVNYSSSDHASSEEVARLSSLLSQNGWLEREFSTAGSLPKVLSVNGFHASLLPLVRRYSTDTLNWRIGLGNAIIRWQILQDYFFSSDPDLRPSVGDYSARYSLSRKTPYHYIDRALAGDFFGRVSDDDLAIIQDPESPFVYFPGKPFSVDQFALPFSQGWPKLPPGLVSSLLPRLSLTLEDFNIDEHFEVDLRHHGPLSLQLAVSSLYKREPSALPWIRVTAAGRYLAFSLRHPEGSYDLLARVTRVLEGSTGDLYTPSPIK